VSTASENAGAFDTLKWLLAIAVIAAGLYANAEFATLTLIYRVLAGLVVVAVFVAIALTTQQGRAVWDLTKEARIERKFFPGYVLVEMELDDSTWHLVKETPRVMGFIGGKADQPAPISNAEAQAILQRVQVGSEKITPKIVFEPGEMVRVVDGPFNDFNGVVEEVNYEKNRLHVAVTIFGRSTPVELDFGQVEKA
jgi:transcriptional antiterminator NusG